MSPSPITTTNRTSDDAVVARDALVQAKEILVKQGIQPSAQRLAIAAYVLFTDEHPSADLVFERVKEAVPLVSRATVYNTLTLFAERGLLRTLVITEGKVLFDPKLEQHHHFIDEETERIVDIPWDTFKIDGIEQFSQNGFAINDYQVVVKGKHNLPR